MGRPVDGGPPRRSRSPARRTCACPASSSSLSSSFDGGHSPSLVRRRRFTPDGIAPRLTYSRMGIYNFSHGPRGDDLGPLQRHCRAAPAPYSRAPRLGGALGGRDWRGPGDQPALRVEAPARAPRRRAGIRAAAGETDDVPHEPGGTEGNPRMERHVRAPLARAAAPHQGTRGGQTMTTTMTEQATIVIDEEIHVDAPIETT